MLVNRMWVATHPNEFAALLKPPDSCPVCMEEFSMQPGDPGNPYSPLGSDCETRCTHFACQSCWEEILNKDAKCPMCRESLWEWLYKSFGDAYAIPDDAVCNDDIRLFVGAVGFVELPPELMAMRERILRHVGSSREAR